MKSKIALCSMTSLMLFAAGCGQPQQTAGGAPVEVSVVTLAPQTVSITNELPGRTAAYRIAEVRPQVSGIVQKRLFKEGSEVKAGQPLLQIDAATYQATVGNAEAELARAQAQLTAAQLLAQRYESLIGKGVISRQDNDNAVASRAQAQADVASAQARLQSAKIDLRFTQVLAPISGRIGRALVTEGALVTNGQQDALATIQQLDPIYVDVAQSSTELLHLQRQLASGELDRGGDRVAEVSLTLEDGTGYPLTGRLQFSEVSVNANTGSVLLRAVFPNPRGELLPGMFVHARLSQGVKQNALLVPQRGVTHNRRGEATVLLVDAGNKVSEKVVKAERVIGDSWWVSQGLNPGDRVIVDGVQKVREGVEVRPIPAKDQQLSNAASSVPTRR